jgi:DNA helicase-2/ATP-dependent DNA helicase PcrA
MADESIQRPQADLGWLSELNEAQRAAVCHGTGPLLIIAGAGTGKTRTLAYRVAYLIATGVPAGRILLLTFTRRAAQEMIRRATDIVSRGAGETAPVWGGTFHSIANRLLRMYAKAAGLSPDFTILDQPDAEDLIDVTRHELGLHKKRRRFPKKRTCLAIYSRRVNGQEDLGEVLQKCFPWCHPWEADLKRLFRRYVQRKLEGNILDYDDLLLYLVQLLGDHSLSERIGGRFDHILVDEYQDTNRAQAQILSGLRRNCSNITVVGDDSQSIYAFRAASVENMFDFPKQFEDTRIVTLEENYRSLPPILETTNRLIAGATRRYTKNLSTTKSGGQRPQLVTCSSERTQDNFVVERVLAHYEEDVPLRRQAVLFRSAYLANTLELELSRRNIPYHKYGGLKFVEAAHVKDLLAFLRVMENPRDSVAWFRILQLVDGVGPATAGKVFRHICNHGFDLTAISSFPAPAAAKQGFSRLEELFRRLSAKPEPSPAVQVEATRLVYRPLLEKRYDNAIVRWNDLQNLEQIASRYPSRRTFLTDLQLDPPTSTSDLAGPPHKDEDWLVLSTIHSAKGCEWDVVYLIHASDGCLPSDMSTGSDEEIEEELRLAYVAATRARDFLYICWPLRYYHNRSSFTDRHLYAQLSRFFTEQVQSTMDLVSAGDGTSEIGDTESDGSDLDIKSRLEAMWD